MLPDSLDLPGGHNPESVRSILDEVGEDGNVDIKTYEDERPLTFNREMFTEVDEGGIHIQSTPDDEGRWIKWDEIEWVKPSEQ
jgi:hypothetical protein